MTDYTGIVINHSMINQKCSYCGSDLRGVASIQLKFGFTARYVCAGCIQKIFDFVYPAVLSDDDKDFAEIIVQITNKISKLEKAVVKITDDRKSAKTKDTKKVDELPEVQGEDTVRDTGK